MAILEGKVKLPGLGEVPKKGVAIGAAAVLGVVTIAYIRRARNASTTNASPSGGTAAAAAGSTDLQTDPAGNTCAAVDPSSGYCPGSEQDQAYQAEQSSGYYGSALDDYGDSEDAEGGLVSNSPYTYGGPCTDANGNPGTYDSLGNCITTAGSTTPTSPTTPAVPTTAEEWVTQTAADIPGSAATFELAAAKVFAGLTVTTAQKDLFLEGVGINPLPANITYPQPIKTSDTSAQPAPGGTKITVPNVVGMRREDAGPVIRRAGLNPSFSASEGTVSDQAPKAGATASKGATVRLTLKGK
jgi:hypothetical protein